MGASNYLMSVASNYGWADLKLNEYVALHRDDHRISRASKRLLPRKTVGLKSPVASLWRGQGGSTDWLAVPDRKTADGRGGASNLGTNWNLPPRNSELQNLNSYSHKLVVMPTKRNLKCSDYCLVYFSI